MLTLSKIYIWLEYFLIMCTFETLIAVETKLSTIRLHLLSLYEWQRNYFRLTFTAQMMCCFSELHTRITTVANCPFTSV